MNYTISVINSYTSYKIKKKLKNPYFFLYIQKKITKILLNNTKIKYKYK